MTFHNNVIGLDKPLDLLKVKLGGECAGASSVQCDEKR